MSPKKEDNNTLILECEDGEIDEMLGKECKRMIIRLLKGASAVA